MPAVSVKDVDQQEFVDELASFIKKSGKIKPPEFAEYVKLGTMKELAPYNEDWYYVRAARKNNGVMPSHWVRGSSSIARKVLQSLEQMNLIEKDKVKGGRKLTSQGRRDLDRIANQIHKRKHAIDVEDE